tara:strand:+ start:212 stop:556 length:345 start_codon:yes stop_codon:yes gene_type:complete
MNQVKEISPTTAYELASNEEAVLIDVREQNELYESKIENAIHIPISLFDSSLIPQEKNKKIVFLCAVGIRSHQVSEYLVSQGIVEEAYNLTGGISAWIQAGLPIQKNYEITQSR